MSTGPYMMTRSGRRFYFDEPDPWQIDLRDIAYALAHLHRFTGHAGAYSVRAHSVQVAACAISLGADLPTKRAALMHDAHEAYVGDISSPLKAAIGSAFAEIDRRAMRAVECRFGIGKWCDRDLVHRADAMVTHAEARHFLGPASHVWATTPWDQWDAENSVGDLFLDWCDAWGIA